jgi:predicted acyltransferase
MNAEKTTRSACFSAFIASLRFIRRSVFGCGCAGLTAKPGAQLEGASSDAAANKLPPQNRALALDALRGLAILAMLLSGQLPFDQNALPAWMYHAQVPPPDFQWQRAVAGITWVDLVFPFFLFAMGAAFPLALSRRLERGERPWRLLLFILERGVLLGFFALFVQAIRPYTLAAHPDTVTWLLALVGFGLLFPVLARLPASWPRFARWGVRSAGWTGAILLLALARYPDGGGFKLTRSDIIIVVLANMAVFGSLVWLLTRQNLLLRVGLLGILLAVRLSNMPQPIEGWVHDIWKYSPAPWIYQLYYLQYLCIVIPGTIAGDLLLQWLKGAESGAATGAQRSWSVWRLGGIALLMAGFVLVALIGLKARWLVSTTLVMFGMCVPGYYLLARPGNNTERLYRSLFLWAIYWLVLGLVFEPYEGGIKKDKATVSYYFVTSGLAICVLIAFFIAIDSLKQRRLVQLLIENGQNPMIAYTGINNFITPVLALSGLGELLSQFATTPWRGFWRGLVITLLMALTVSFLTRRKVFWRT